SVFRISFHERRMQFMEKEHLDYWRQSRPGERILDIDIPLSYNLSDVKISPAHINMAEVIWEGGKSRVGDSSSDCGVFVKLHCISTEFTARKHGGEKGIPFRLQVDTFDNATGNHLQSLAAQVKVFKPKGADRKHKTDREKVEKRTESERSKYQPSLLYTPFKPTVYLSEQGLLSLVKPELKSAADRPADGVVSVFRQLPRAPDQFMEKEHLDYWRQSRPGERILDIDIPLSYNLSDVKISPAHINMAEVIWEGGKSRSATAAQTAAYSCTASARSSRLRKHGGEKGIPFRLQVDTFDNATGNHLQSLAAQVKVFKPKAPIGSTRPTGRKWRSERKASAAKYQPSLLYTPFKPTVYLSEQGLLSLVKPELKSLPLTAPPTVLSWGHKKLTVEEKTQSLTASRRPALERSNAAAVTAGLAARQAPNRALHSRQPILCSSRRHCC
uniref:CP2 domain-containing protein n=1 Tax=Macrostomum lignano TaxID=282301 RepID=A0A1I8FWC0_9PLAT